jgi:hypothetical protein
LTSKELLETGLEESDPNFGANDEFFAGRESVSSRGGPGRSRESSSRGTAQSSRIDFTVRIIYYFNI